MFTKTFSVAAVALAASSMVSAQTFTDCNPLKTTCPADPAFGNSKVTCDFTKGECDAFSSVPGTTLEYGDKGAIFKIATDAQAPTIKTGKYIFFGRIDVVVQAAAGKGVVTSAVLQSDDLDEIDWEWVGGDNTQVQTNYFSKGDTSTYDRGAFHAVANPINSFHTYTVEWTSKGVNWLIDGNVVRTLNADNAKGGAAALPQSPMQIKLGTWVAGRPGAPEGTVQWAGGYVDLSNGPALGYYKSISIVDYAGTDGPSDKSVKEYVYTDHSGSWQSIQVKAGDGSSDPKSSSTSAKASATQTSGTASGTSSGTSKPSSTDSSKTSTGDKASTTADSKTTLATVTPTTGSGSNSTVSVTPTGSKPSTTAKPSTVPGTNAGVRSSTAIGSVLLAGAGLALAQLFL